MCVVYAHFFLTLWKHKNILQQKMDWIWNKHCKVEAQILLRMKKRSVRQKKKSFGFSNQIAVDLCITLRERISSYTFLMKKNWHSRTEWKECVCATYLCRAPLCCISLAMGWSCTVLSALSVCARETERDRERVFEGG